MNEILLAIIISSFVSLLVFLFYLLSKGRIKPRETSPFLSGEKSSSIEVEYHITWIYYASIFVIFESFFLPIVFSFATKDLFPVLVYVAIFLLIAISIPKPRRGRSNVRNA
jgi:NADH:ubiquinone oxidoreductase subunit 3 (subunit A)